MFSHLPPEASFALAGVFGLLAVASLTVAALGWLKPDRAFREVRDRVRTWWVIVLLFGGAMLFGRRAAIVFLAFVSFLALKEYLSLIPTRRADRRVLFWAYLAIPVQYYWAHEAWYGVFIIFIPVYVFFLIPTRMMLIGETTGFVSALSTLHWGLMTTVFSLSHAAYLLVLRANDSARVAPQWPSAESIEAPGAGLLVFLVLLTEANDVAQFLWGKAIGRRKISPKISPGKTVGGLVGGVATTIVVGGLLGPWLTLMDTPRSLMAAAVIGVGGFLGDLSISAIKRDLGVKDSGFTLPGHGGVLDRVDSLSYTAPLFFHFIYYCYF